MRSTRLTVAPLALGQLSQIAPVGADRLDAIPAVRRFATGRFATQDLQALATVELAFQHAGELLRREFAAHAQAELDRKTSHGPLQPGRELAIGRHDLESAIDMRHGTDRDVATTHAPRQSRNEGFTTGGRIRLQQRLTRRTMAEKSGRAGGRCLAHQLTVEADLVTALGAYPKRRDFAIDRDPTGPDPFLGFPARRQSGARQDLLHAFCAVRLLGLLHSFLRKSVRGFPARRRPRARHRPLTRRWARAATAADSGLRAP